MKILIFTEGTALIHGSVNGIHDYRSYTPIHNAVEKIKRWKEQGATIYYLTSRRVKGEIEAIENVLQKYGFSDHKNILYRQQGENYKNVAEKLIPNILIEDDCESIGGVEEMTYTHLNPEIKRKIHSITVQEFGGIDLLPDNLNQLKDY